MSFRGSCPEPVFSGGEARSPIFFSSRSNGNIRLKWDDKKGKIGF